MKRIAAIGLATVLLGPASVVKAHEDEIAKGLTIHEWGTFLTMSGSDGVTLDGMYHEEHALPDFVHARSRDQLKMRSALIKGETPVIYFYTDRPQKVNVRVDFPGGVWTQWYPQASLIGPGLAASGPATKMRNGHIDWNVNIEPARASGNPALPAASKDALWNYARQVDAAFVRTSDETKGSAKQEYERFLFYRGLGSVEMPLQANAQGLGTAGLGGSAQEPVKHLFVLRVENGKGSYKYIPELRPGGSLEDIIPDMSKAKPLPEFTNTIADDLAGRLTESGLYAKESRAMVNTWKTSYFGTEGIRVLYVLPQTWTDRFIPMRLAPKPEKFVRVMVGRCELLTPAREQRAESAVRDLKSEDAAIRNKAYAFLREQGRYVEPILKRVQSATTDSTVKSLCTRLLLTDFVTGLKTSTTAAPDGARVVEKPVFLRAQLSSLLRDIGLNAEARAEGMRTLSELDRVTKPAENESGARHHLRAYALAIEGMGDDRGAAEWYGKFIAFGSQSTKCGNCHHEEGPRNMAWYRDWWAGQRYAAAVKRAGLEERTIKEQKDQLAANSNNVAAKMKLGYLLEARGDLAQAEVQWASIEGRPVRAVAGNDKVESKVSTASIEKRAGTNAKHAEQTRNGSDPPR
jgi:hypothetical protein